MNAADSARRKNFDLMTVEERERAIRRMADEGFHDYDIAAATDLSVEAVREIIGQRQRGS